MRQLNVFLSQISCAVFLSFSSLVLASNLSLTDAENAALVADPAIERNDALAASISETAIADGQLADPKLTFGLFNLPSDDFDLNKNSATQLRLGVKQALPKGDTLRFKKLKGAQYALAKKHQTEWLKRKTLLDVRLSYLESFYHQGTVEILNKNRRYFVDLLKTTENFYGVGRVNQQDVLLAKLELSRLEDRINQAQNLFEINKAMLGKWVPSAQQQDLDDKLPMLKSPTSLKQTELSLIHHPMVQIDDALVAAAKQDVLLAEEQYKPGFNVGVEYRKRFGDELNGQHRADLVAAMVTMELPIFPEKRQDKRLSSSQYGYQSFKLKRSDTLRNMRQQLNQHYGNWLRLTERSERYKTYLQQQATENTKAALRAYQSGVADFSTLLQARITELETGIQHNRINVDKTKAQARVLFYSVSKE